MRALSEIHFSNRNEFGNWLKKHHETSPGIRMIFYKKHTGKENISYSEAVEEAICFGWIDSIVKRIDDEKYSRKFTPRINTTNWSDINKERARKMLAQGKMTDSGLKKIDVYTKTGKLDWGKPPATKNETMKVPDFIKSFLRQNEPAWKNFNKLAPSHIRNYTLWITSAKKEETKIKRLHEAAELLKEDKKPGMK